MIYIVKNFWIVKNKFKSVNNRDKSKEKSSLLKLVYPPRMKKANV